MWQQNNWELNRGARAAQVRRKSGRRPPTAREDGVEGADRKSARGTLQLPPQPLKLRIYNAVHLYVWISSKVADKKCRVFTKTACKIIIKTGVCYGDNRCIHGSASTAHRT